MTHVDIPFLRYLDEEGRPVATLPTWLDKAMLHTFYRNMVMVRSYDKKAIALQRTGKLCTFPSHLGAEAVGIGVGLAMQPEDVYVPYYRDMPTLYVRGVPMEQNLQYWGGDERGSVFYKADGELSEDDCKGLKDEIQELTKKYENAANDLAKAKETEVSES